MKKTVIITILINVFLLLCLDALNEYTGMKNKTMNIYSEVSSAVDSSISAVLSSEEFFSSTTDTKSGAPSVASISVWNGSDFTKGNMYLISFLMKRNEALTGELRVPSQSEYNLFINSEVGSANVERYCYEYLYGNISTRQPTPEFSEFYNNIGRLVTINSDVLIKGGNLSRVALTYPILARMGLRLGDINEDSTSYMLGTGSDNNQFTSVDKYVGYDKYYLTPSSLYVTYLNKNVLRNVIYCSLDTAIRCNRVSNITNASFGSASGTLPTNVFTLSGEDSEAHRNSSGHTVVNDGAVEFFMDTLDVDITYYLVDFYDNKNWQIVDYIVGSGVSTSPTLLPSVLKSKETLKNADNSIVQNNWVVVAKVDVTIDLSIPHESSVMQWNRYRNSTGSDEFYGVLGFDTSGNLLNSDGGLQYKYTTFSAVVR